MMTGLHVLINENFKRLKGSRIGLIANHTSVGRDLVPSYLHLLQEPSIRFVRLFSPEHGFWGIAQDQELVESDTDQRTGLQTMSLYGDQLSPSEESLADLDVIVFDIQDVGVRYYTYIYTMLLTMKAATKRDIPVLILDRPNPLGGTRREGNILDMDFTSFVGLYPLPVVHGMTVGEIALYINKTFSLECELQVIPCQGWQRKLLFDETDLVWIAPSPNMPSLSTAIVYAGCCLFEATNISEGRGTTLPFELIGAPWIDPWGWARELNELSIAGVLFRPLYFRPMTNKYAGQVCGGVQIHVLNRDIYPSYFTGVAMIRTAFELYEKDFQWKKPPYEFETKKMPFDILTGTDKIRQHIENHHSLAILSRDWEIDSQKFTKKIEGFLLYS